MISAERMKSVRMACETSFSSSGGAPVSSSAAWWPPGWTSSQSFSTPS